LLAIGHQEIFVSQEALLAPALFFNNLLTILHQVLYPSINHSYLNSAVKVNLMKGTNCFLWLTTNITAFEIRNWNYNLVFIIAEAILALVLSFTTTYTNFSAYISIHYGIFSSIRSATTMFNFPQYLDAFDIVNQGTWNTLIPSGKMTECANVLLHPRSFYMARFVSVLPLRLAGSLVLTAIIYPIAGLRSGFHHLLIFLLTLMLQSMAGLATAMMISAICARSSGLSSYIGTLVLSVNIVFAGTVVPPNQVTPILRWLHYLTFGYFATIAYNHNQYDGVILMVNNQRITGKQFLKMRGLTDLPLWGAIGVLIGQICVFNIIGMSALAFHWGRQAGK
jgi:hypothetical protein